MKRLLLLTLLLLAACDQVYQPPVPLDDILSAPQKEVVQEPVVVQPEPVVEPVVEAAPVEVVETPEPRGSVENIDVILRSANSRVEVLFENGEETFILDETNQGVILGLLAGKYNMTTKRADALTTFLKDASLVEEKEVEEEVEYLDINYTKVVDIIGYKFNPEVLYVKQGTRVVWTHRDLATHTITATTNKFDSGEMVRGDTFTYDFFVVGTYEYYSEPYPSMRGKIIVQK